MENKKNYNNMYKPKEEKKTLGEIKEDLVEAAPAEEPATPKKAKAEESEVKKEVKKTTVPAKKKESKRIGKVTGGLSLNVRKAPNGEIIKAVPNGSILTIIGEDGEWYKISEPLEGFVMKKFVQV